MCGRITWRIVYISFTPLSMPSCTYTWPLLHPRVLVASSDPWRGVSIGIVNLLMIFAQCLEQETHSIHARTRRRRLQLFHLESGWKAYRETFASSIGRPVNATAGSIVHLNTRRPLTRNLEAPMLRMKKRNQKTLRTQLWNFSQWTTWHKWLELGYTEPRRAPRRVLTTLLNNIFKKDP